jgi:hypothetical protein
LYFFAFSIAIFKETGTSLFPPSTALLSLTEFSTPTPICPTPKMNSHTYFSMNHMTKNTHFHHQGFRKPPATTIAAATAIEVTLASAVFKYN